MTLHLLFLMIDLLAIFTILILGIAVLKSAPRSVSAQLFAAITLNTACYQVWSRYAFSAWIPEAYEIQLGAIQIPIMFLMNSTPGLFMLMCFRLFRDNESVPTWLVALFAVQLALDVPASHLIVGGDAGVRGFWFDTVPAGLQLLFVGFGLHWTLKDWRVDMVETRRLLRFAFVAILGVMTLGVTLVERLLITPGSIESFYFHEGYNVLCVAINTLCIVALLKPHAAYSSKLVARAAPAMALSETTVDRDFEEFDRAMRENRLYREAGLTIASLALKLSIPEYRLRRLINTKLGYRNFNAMLNHYRVAEASSALTDPSQRNTPILTIALTAGYQSINPFNRAFRELKGTSPSDFRRQHFAKD
jgi:AraC-like DNA-binding protein